LGVTGKYLSSELAESESATAMAADLGGQYKANSRLNIGLAIQNVGTKLKYQDVGDDLPRVARMGMAYKLHTRLVPAQLLLDIPYHMNQRNIVPSVGLETFLNGLIVRAGSATPAETLRTERAKLIELEQQVIGFEGQITALRGERVDDNPQPQ
jgi:hypothetical protein